MGTIELRNKWKKEIVNVDERFLRLIDALHTSYMKEETDFFDEIPSDIQELLQKSREDIKKGKTYTHESILNEAKTKYNIS
ncbi:MULTISPECIES: hypothetical protein [Polaribacter]|uniref:Addiction module antitoxin RelB n=1 Tax=Polaribacter sejongensis TaxID=985043 RepID=A0ABM6Q1G6_9FLAO|nr:MULTISPECIES: hypothetical protein [Polaribacter]AUC22987.1 hypothetical protein BTO15_13195 [Polaribacter sejongensis]